MKDSKTLSQRLRELEDYPFHMPGHKRNPRYDAWGLPFERDITEIEGFDNLHHPEGLIKEGQERLASCYGVKEAFYLVNGSTCGILSAISACVGMGGRLLMGRNAHKSAYHAAFLRNLNLSYLVPSLEETGINGDILPSDVEKGLREHPDTRAVFVTSPTYDGVVSDIRGIAQVCQAHGVPLIVDGAHGAHLGFSKAFPEPSQALGADIVIVSLHKTLPSLTQTAALLRCSDRVSGDALKRYLSIYESSSPSYVLMESMDRLTAYLEGQESRDDFARLEENLVWLRDGLGKNRMLRLLTPKNVFAFDPSKILLSGGRFYSGRRVASFLRREHHLEMEMEAEQYCLALTSVGDTREGFLRLLRASQDLDSRIWKLLKERGDSLSGFSMQEKDPPDFSSSCWHTPTLPRQQLSLCQAWNGKSRLVEGKEAKGRISAEFLSLYPPGIPLVVPGEVIGEELLALLEKLSGLGWEIHGMRDNRYLSVTEEA